MRDVARVIGLVVLGLVLVVGAAAAGTYLVTEMQLSRRVTAPNDTVAVSTDITTIQRGQHLASAVARCIECHGGNLAGKVYIDDPSLGRIVSPNLTGGRGGVGRMFSDTDFVRAIRYGVDPTGRQLLLMPADDYVHFSDADLGAIIAYVRSVVAIDTSLPMSEIRLLGRALFALGQLPLQPAASIDRGAPRPPAPRAGASIDYGAYLAHTAGCLTCHGPGLGGGKAPGAPSGTVAAANITTAAIGRWSEADFARAMRSGIRPDGRRLDTMMPWPYYAQLTDDELRALWRYLQAMPPRETGSR